MFGVTRKGGFVQAKVDALNVLIHQPILKVMHSEKWRIFARVFGLEIKSFFAPLPWKKLRLRSGQWPPFFRAPILAGPSAGCICRNRGS